MKPLPACRPKQPPIPSRQDRTSGLLPQRNRLRQLLALSDPRVRRRLRGRQPKSMTSILRTYAAAVTVDV